MTPEQLIIKYKDVFGTKNGKDILEDLDMKCLLKREIFVEDSERKTCFNLGVNWVIRYIHKKIDTNLMDVKQTEVINKGVEL